MAWEPDYTHAAEEWAELRGEPMGILLEHPAKHTREKGDDPIDALAFLLAEVAGFDWREINTLELVSLRTIATFSSAAARERITEMRRAAR